MFDVAIIGGSVAGSSAASLLGRAGLRVLLLDRKSFPREKACGEGISAAGVSLAQQLDLLPGRVLFQLQKFSGFTVHSGRHRGAVHHVRAGGAAVARTELDSALWEQAASTPGVVAVDSARVRGVTTSGLGATREFCVRADNVTLSARCVVFADGGASPMARDLGVTEMRRGVARLGVSVHFGGSFAPLLGSVQIVVCGEKETYITPLNEHTINVACLSRAPGSGDSKSDLKGELGNALGDLSGRLGLTLDGDRLGPIIGRSGVGYVRRSGLSQNLFLIGDAIEEFDPIGGMGMTHAFLSAFLASKEIARICKAAPSELACGIGRYEASRRRYGDRLRAFTVMTYQLLRLANRFPPILPIAANSWLGSVVGGATRYLCPKV